jgi:DNA repair exonuclease SbcCD ATPase subunit
MSSTSPVVTPAANTVTETTSVADAALTLTERISKIEESLKELKRAAKQLEKQVGRRRRRTPRGQKGETPQQLRAWHEEVHRVWEDMKKSDKATLYKKAVAEAARRRGGSKAVVAPVVAAPAPAAPATAAKASKKAAKKA